MWNLTLGTFEDIVLESPVPCVVKFSKKTCPLCKGLTPVFLKLQSRYGNLVRFATIDIGLYKDISKIFDLDGVPSVFIFVNGDGEEIPYPENPSPLSGYHEKYLISYINKYLI